MLVQNSVYRNTYLTDGVNKDFYFSFPVLEASQVLVQTSLLTNTDVATTVDPSQYTVTGVGQTTGGHISFTTAPPAGSRIALTLNIPITQLYQYAELDSFPAKSHENALAKLTLICQQLKEQISRAVLISTTSEGSTADIIASLYAARDSATASATAADLSAVSAEASATSAGLSATAAQQSAVDAAANSAGLVTEVQNLSAMYIGKIFALPATDTYVPNGCSPANAAEYTRAQFPTLYDDYLVAGKLLTCTYAEFAAQVALTGNCGKFALDTVNQKFKVPLLKDGDSITQATSASELGKSYEAGLPEIAATFGGCLTSGGTGACYNPGTPITDNYNGGPYQTNKTGFKASLYDAIYGRSNTVTDEQVRLRHFVVLASAQNNASVFDWSNYMAGLAGKANNDLSNVDLTKANVVLQRVRYQTSANATTQVTMPWDNTVPQITEGTKFMSINFTPRKADSRLVIDVLFNGTGYGSSGWHLIVAIFQDTIQDAIDSGVVHGNAAYVTRNLSLSIEVPAGSVAPRTYSVRAGCSDGGMGFNGNGAGVNDLGGTIHSHITVTEYAA